MRVFATILFIAGCIVVLSYRGYSDSQAQEVENYFLQMLDSLEIATNNLEHSIISNERVEEKAAFRKLRSEYKRISILTDYLNPYETILLNSQPIPRTEEDNPTVIIQPHGFQQLEMLIWGNQASNVIRSEKLVEIKYLKNIFTELENEPGRINKFNNVMVWDALRYSMVTLVTKTIAGFDTPLALNSIMESKATIESIQSLVDIYQQVLNHASPNYYDSICISLQRARKYLSAPTDFNRFDRLYFIKNITNPLSNNLSNAAILLGYINPDERRSVNPFALNVFSKNAFDINFFSPNRRYQFTPERMLLGKKLFNETKLSGSGQRSCANCHKPELAFTDGLPKALSVDNKSFLNRNTPTLLNAVFQTRQFYDSRESMLEFQIASVIHNEKEMGGSTEVLARAIRDEEDWRDLFVRAYPGEKDPVSVYTIANAIASYLRSLQAMNTKFDQYLRDEPVNLTAAETKGFNLFMGKAKCGTCHFIPLFNGLIPPLFSETESEVIGVPVSAKKPFRLDADSGKYYFTRSVVHLHAFKTPTLRNIALTGPYMHNGIYKTLEEVIDFYNNGGGKGLGIAPNNQTLPFDKLNLSKVEKKNIIYFLFALTDTTSYKIPGN